MFAVVGLVVALVAGGLIIADNQHNFGVSDTPQQTEQTQH